MKTVLLLISLLLTSFNQRKNLIEGKSLNIKKQNKMANLKDVNFDYIKKWEGGLSCHKLDSASRHIVPDTVEHPNPKGYHTNVGVTWQAWASIHGRSDKAVRDFYKMPKEKWVQVYKWYWDVVGGSRINNQIIAEFCADFAWGSGTTACFQMQKFLNSEYGYQLGVDGKIGKRSIYAMNEAIKKEGPVNVYKALYEWRCDWIKGIPSFKDFGRGWMNRLEDFHQWALSVLESE